MYITLILLFVYFVHSDVPLDIPIYTIDLDLDPHDRWSHIIPNFLEPMYEFNDNVRKRIPKAYIEAAEIIATKLDGYIPEPYRGEFYSIAHALSMPVADIVLVNIVYELATYCSSMLIRTSNNTILHGRNLDFYIQTNLLRRLTFHAKFIRTSKPEFHYESIHFAGAVGIFTGLRQGYYSLSINQRSVSVADWWMNLLVLFLPINGLPLFILTRSLFDNPYMSYQEMKYILQHQRLIAPVYFVITDGRTSGMIITRNRLSSINPIELDTVLVQTNYDHWLIDPLDDPRRTTAEKILSTFNSTQMTGNNIFDNVLSVIPVLNPDTVYSAIIDSDEKKSIFAKIRTLKPRALT